MICETSAVARKTSQVCVEYPVSGLPSARLMTSRPTLALTVTNQM